MPRMKDGPYSYCPMCECYTAELKEATDWSRKYSCVACSNEFTWFDGSMPIRKDGQLVGFTRNFRGDA
jgi:hypothetical protein